MPASGCNQIPSAINPGVMPYALRFYLYLLVADVLVVVLAVWLSPLGRIVNLLFAIAAGYLTIIIGRRALGRKHL